MHRVGQLGARNLFSVRNQEGLLGEVVSVYFSDFNPCDSVLYRGCTLVGGSVMGGSTVYVIKKIVIEPSLA